MEFQGTGCDDEITIEVTNEWRAWYLNIGFYY